MQFTEKINPNITPFLHINQKTEEDSGNRGTLGSPSNI